MSAYFVSGTGTDIGKTYVLTHLIASSRASGKTVDALKPVVSGFDPEDAMQSDPILILQALQRPVTSETLDAIAPWRFRAPLSPNIAARAESRPIDFDDVVTFSRRWLSDAAGRCDVAFVEGAGGLFSPLADTATNADFALALGLAVVLVCGTYLGAISHTIATADACRLHGIPLAHVIVNQSTPSAMSVARTMASLVALRPALPCFGLNEVAL